MDRERRTSNTTTTTMSNATQTTPCSTAVESVDVVAAKQRNRFAGTAVPLLKERLSTFGYLSPMASSVFEKACSEQQMRPEHDDQSQTVAATDDDDPLEVQSHCSERSVERRVFVAAATRKVKSSNDLASACVDNDRELHDRFAVLAAQHHHHQQQWKLSEQNRRRSFSTLRDLLGALDEENESLPSSVDVNEMRPLHAATTPPRAADA